MVYVSPFYSLKAVVASEHPIASAVGANVLRRGGSAVDAAAATAFVLSVVLPHLGGLGGDFFALVRDPDGNISFINGSGPAPKHLSRDLMVELGYNSMPEHGPLTISIPGFVNGVYTLWRKFGFVEWSELLEPAIRLAREGFPTSESLSDTLLTLRDQLSSDYGSRMTYYPMGESPKVGDILKFEGIARAIELIKEDPRSFYEGDIAKKIVSYVKSLGGVIELSDLKDYRAEVSDPIRASYRGCVIYEMPPNTQGITTLHILKILEDVSLHKLCSLSSRRLATFLAAAKVAYKVRDEYVTDPRYMKVSTEQLLSDSFIDELRVRFREVLTSRKSEKYGGGAPGKSGGGDTTFFAIADGEGWLVAGIQSLFYPFGSYVTEPTYGITLNSRASSFSLSKDHINCLEPGKKTMHTLSAMIIERGNDVLALGLSGGHFRPLLHAEILTNMVDYFMRPQEAIEHPRFVWHLWSDLVDVEEGYIFEGIEGYIFRKVRYPSRLGVAAAAGIRGKLRAGFTDMRGDGLPIGLV